MRQGAFTVRCSARSAARMTSRVTAASCYLYSARLTICELYNNTCVATHGGNGTSSTPLVPQRVWPHLAAEVCGVALDAKARREVVPSELCDVWDMGAHNGDENTPVSSQCKA